MCRCLSGLVLCAALFAAACAPMISPREAPTRLKNTIADSIFAFAADERCAELRVNETAIEVAVEDVLVEMINAGYSGAQFDAMLVGLDTDDDWFIPYAISFERKHDIELDDEAAFCRALQAERSARSSLGLMLQ